MHHHHAHHHASRSVRIWTPTRRQFIGGTLAAGLLAACGGSDEADDSDSSSPSGDSAGGSEPNQSPATDGGAGTSAIEAGTWTLVQRFPQNVQGPGELRLPFSLSTGSAEFVEDGPAELGAQVLSLDGEQIGDRITAVRRDVSPAPYYAFRTDIAEPGFYSLVVDGGPPDGANFDVAEPGSIPVPVPGDPLPPFDTPTTDDGRGVDPVCTRDPICPFHGATLTDALATGRPVVYYVGTPAFCSTGTCAPGLEALITAQPDYAGDFEFVHAEVYTDLTATEVAPALEPLGLFYEPVLYVTDADGLVVDRLDALFDETELRETLDRALG